ncbi:MAG: hypothetical protein PUC82_04285 [bacterium]|nr:hypothetical protein [bacterium]
MGNKSNGIKRILQDKNTVTLLGVVAAILVLIIGYNVRVKQAINPITVPCAKEAINGGTKITEDKIMSCQIPKTMIKGDIIQNSNQVLDQYVRSDTVIPAGSYFFKSVVVEREQLPDNIILNVPKGYVLYNMSVTTATTYGNSIYPENYIDIYLKAVSKYEEGVTSKAEADRIMLGKLVTNVKVLAVKDASGQPVFANLDEQRAPAMIVFAVPEEYYILLKKAEYLRNYDTTLIPVPTNESLSDEPGEVAISSESLKDWINKVTIWTES